MNTTFKTYEVLQKIFTSLHYQNYFLNVSFKNKECGMIFNDRAIHQCPNYKLSTELQKIELRVYLLLNQSILIAFLISQYIFFLDIILADVFLHDNVRLGLVFNCQLFIKWITHYMESTVFVYVQKIKGTCT